MHLKLVLGKQGILLALLIGCVYALQSAADPLFTWLLDPFLSGVTPDSSAWPLFVAIFGVVIGIVTLSTCAHVIGASVALTVMHNEAVSSLDCVKRAWTDDKGFIHRMLFERVCAGTEAIFLFVCPAIVMIAVSAFNNGKISFSSSGPSSLVMFLPFGCISAVIIQKLGALISMTKGFATKTILRSFRALLVGTWLLWGAVVAILLLSVTVNNGSVTFTLNNAHLGEILRLHVCLVLFFVLIYRWRSIMFVSPELVAHRHGGAYPFHPEPVLAAYVAAVSVVVLGIWAVPMPWWPALDMGLGIVGTLFCLGRTRPTSEAPPPSKSIWVSMLLAFAIALPVCYLAWNATDFAAAWRAAF